METAMMYDIYDIVRQLPSMSRENLELLEVEVHKALKALRSRERSSLKARREAEKEAEKQRLKDRAIAELDKIAQSHGFKSAKSVFKERKQRSGPAVKHRDPITGKIWNGHGHRPPWVGEHTAITDDSE